MTVTPGSAKDTTQGKRAGEADVAAGNPGLDFRTLAEASLSGIIVFQDERMVYVNPAAAEMVGYTRDELIGRWFLEVIHPEFRKMAGEHALLQLRGEQAGPRIEIKIVGKDGQERWTESLTSLIEYNGRPAVLVSVADITERKQAAEALRKNEKFLNNVFNCIQDGVSVLSKDLSVISYNPTIERWHGKDLTGKKCYRLFHGREEPCETCPSVRAIREKTMQREVVHDLYGWKELFAYPLVNDDGEVTGTIEQVRDITERKQAEAVLNKNLAVLARSQEIAHVGSWSIDFDSDRFELSDEIYRMHGFEPGTIEPTLDQSSKLTHPDDLEHYQEYVESMRREGRLGNIDYRVMWPDGSVHYMHARTDGVFRSEDGRVKMASGITQDITDRKRAEEELKAAKQQAELYLDLMGHDINNMHQIALGYLEMARDVHPEAGLSEFLDKPIEVLHRSAQLINNVRKLQKLKEGVFQSRDVDVCQMLLDVQQEFGAVPHKAITLDMNDCTHCQVRANELLHDVFANLVSNAIKHTGDRADIAINVEVLNENGSRYCRVMVEDNGPGIPDDFKGKIFNRMLKGTTNAKGMGLGLYLVKSLVGSYGGRVWVEDRVPGDHTKGAKFVVVLPAVGEPYHEI